MIVDPDSGLYEASSQQYNVVLFDGVKADRRIELGHPYFESSSIQTLSEILYKDVVCDTRSTLLCSLSSTGSYYL